MPNTGKHQEVKSKQNLDGTFEFIVEDSDASEVPEEEVEAPESEEAQTSRPSRGLMLLGVAAALMLGAIALVYAMGTSDKKSAEAPNENSGFRPYKASGSNVEVPANAPSNEIPVEESAEANEPGAQPDEVIEEGTNAEVEVVEEPETPPEEEFVEADEIIGDGEILDGPEEEMLESAGEKPPENFGRVLKPSIDPGKLDVEGIQENIRSELRNGVNPRQIKGLRHLSPAQIQQLEQNFEKQLPQQDIEVEGESVE